MNEFKKRAIERLLAEESSALGRQRRKAMEMYENSQTRAAIDRIIEDNRRMAGRALGFHMPKATDTLTHMLKNIALAEHNGLVILPSQSQVLRLLKRFATSAAQKTSNSRNLPQPPLSQAPFDFHKTTIETSQPVLRK